MDIRKLDAIAKDAADLATQWQDCANALLSRKDRKRQRRVARMIGHQPDKVFLVKMLDQCFRSSDPARVADQICRLFRQYGYPAFLSPSERLMFRLFMVLGRHVPALTIPLVVAQIRKNSSDSVIPGEPRPFMAYLARRKAQGIRVNINHLGEAVLGEDEAKRRLDGYIEHLSNPAIEYISVKLSTIYSQIEPLAFDNTIVELKQRLTLLFRAARDNRVVDGASKFVNLDMEEFHDLEVTSTAFMATLDQEEFQCLSAGIALQAYLPESYEKMRDITTWARQRVQQGGSPIHIRIVKGANLEMEQVEAALRNWPQAPFDNKQSVDANYKRMVIFGMEPDHIRAVRLGIASHNLFDLAFAYTVARQNGVEQFMTFEMLEGMGRHLQLAVHQVSGKLLLYAPVVTRVQFINAIAYLIRRLSENTAEQNFLRYAYHLTTASDHWEFLKQQFFDSVQLLASPSFLPNRTQDRNREVFTADADTGGFQNEPDTDFSLQANRKWADAIRRKWMNIAATGPLQIPVVIGGAEIFEAGECRRSYDPSRWNEQVHIYSHAMATSAGARQAVDVARQDPDGWRVKDLAERRHILSNVAMELRRSRGDLIGAAAADTGKVFAEADIEVSEAVDFAGYYPRSVEVFERMEHVTCSPKGVGLVISPWNFPVAIPCGGIMAMLAAGNTVIFKPSSDSVLVGYELCKCIWRAGVSKNVLQFVPCSGESVGSVLTGHEGIDCIILTGSTETGRSILKNRPSVQLAAETGGKNATIVTAMADREQAIAHVVRSAFGNSGQKCSATSLLILEKEVYKDPVFRRQLVDAARSWKVGSAWDFRHKMGALIKPPGGGLKMALTRLELGEEWAFKPECVDGNPYIWSPGIKWGVSRGSFTHMTEFFGPLLAVMCATDLEDAVSIANETGYGLTAGLESLDIREQAYWKEHIIAGNLYINRGTTGAIVLRQPFGGMRKSAIGAGIKAGGPNYVAQFMDFTESGRAEVPMLQQDHVLLGILEEWEAELKAGKLEIWRDDLEKTMRATKSYLYHYEHEFGVERDYFHLRGQDNLARYLPAGTMLVRVHPADSLFEVLARCMAALTANCSVILSIPPGLKNKTTGFLNCADALILLSRLEEVHESDASVVRRLGTVQMVRYASPGRVPEDILKRGAELGVYIARTPVLAEGRVELLHYLQEQSVCDSYHRYGNLVGRDLS